MKYKNLIKPLILLTFLVCFFTSAVAIASTQPQGQNKPAGIGVIPTGTVNRIPTAEEARRMAEQMQGKGTGTTAEQGNGTGAAGSNGSSNGGSKNPPPAPKKNPWEKGSFCYPYGGVPQITSPYGKRMHPILHDYIMHTGIDFAVDMYQAVYAVQDGTVVAYDNWTEDTGYGKFVVIDHTHGVRTKYGHNSEVLVKTGDHVKQGQVIAYAGSTGQSTGPHGHFEVIVNGNFEDPLPWFDPKLIKPRMFGRVDEEIHFNFHAILTEDITKPIREVTETFGKVSTESLKKLIASGPVRDLFYILLSIDIGITIFLGLFGTEFEDLQFFNWLIRKILLYGFFIFIYQNWGAISDSIRTFFATVGVMVSGNSAGGDIDNAMKIMSDPTEFLRVGAKTVNPLFTFLNDMSPTYPAENFISTIFVLLTIIVVLGIFVVLTVQLSMVFIEFYIYAIMAFVAYSIVGLRWTRSYGANAIAGLITVGLRLMVTLGMSLLIMVNVPNMMPQTFFVKDGTPVEINASSNDAADGTGGGPRDFYGAIEKIKQIETGGYKDPYRTYSKDGYGYGITQINFENWDEWCTRFVNAGGTLQTNSEIGADQVEYWNPKGHGSFKYPWTPHNQDKVTEFVLMGYYNDKRGQANKGEDAIEYMVRSWNGGTGHSKAGTNDYWINKYNNGKNVKVDGGNVLDILACFTAVIITIMCFFLINKLCPRLINHFMGAGFTLPGTKRIGG